MKYTYKYTVNNLYAMKMWRFDSKLQSNLNAREWKCDGNFFPLWVSRMNGRATIWNVRTKHQVLRQNVMVYYRANCAVHHWDQSKINCRNVYMSFDIVHRHTHTKASGRCECEKVHINEMSCRFYMLNDKSCDMCGCVSVCIYFDSVKTFSWYAPYSRCVWCGSPFYVYGLCVRVYLNRLGCFLYDICILSFAILLDRLFFCTVKYAALNEGLNEPNEWMTEPNQTNDCLRVNTFCLIARMKI